MTNLVIAVKFFIKFVSLFFMIVTLLNAIGEDKGSMKTYYLIWTVILFLIWKFL